jgi:hypothetical protein
MRRYKPLSTGPLILRLAWLEKVGLSFTAAAAANKLIRIPKLIAQHEPKHAGDEALTKADRVRNIGREQRVKSVYNLTAK